MKPEDAHELVSPELSAEPSSPDHHAEMAEAAMSASEAVTPPLKNQPVAPLVAAVEPVHSIPEAKAITKQRARDIGSLLQRYVKRYLPERQPAMKRPDAPPRAVGAHARLLPVLRLIPWVLAALFGLSFFWDFPGIIIAPFGYTMPLEGLLRILAVSGLIGFFTNWLAITMLFNPRERRPIFGQGLIPAQRERVIFRLAKAVSEELINEQIIKQKIEESGVIPRYREMALTITRSVIEDPEFRDELKGLTGDYVQQVLGSEEVRKRIVDFTVEKLEVHLGQGLGGMALKAYRYLNEGDLQRRIDAALRELPNALDDALDEMDHLLDRIPEKIEARSEDIELWATRVVLGFVENLDVYGMIVGNMENYDEQQLENLLKKTSNEQLNYIKYLGGILGALGGFVIWRPVLALSVFGVIGLALYTIDEVLFRARRKALAVGNPGTDGGNGL